MMFQTSILLLLSLVASSDAFVVPTVSTHARHDLSRPLWIDEFGSAEGFSFLQPKSILETSTSTTTKHQPKAGITLSRYMREIAHANPELEDIESIFVSIEAATKKISQLVRTSYITGTNGVEGSINVQGEEQKKLDIITNDVLKDALQWSGKLSTLASEEEDHPVHLVDDDEDADQVLVDREGGYVAVFDPLDGSSNVDAGISTGTIFGIFGALDEDEEDLEICSSKQVAQQDDEDDKCLQNVLQPGKNLVAAGYCLYSSATTLVFSLGDGVHGFTLDESVGEFVLTHPNIQIPSRGKIYSFNEANRWEWDEPLQDYLADIQQGKGESRTKYTSRYIGSMVGDVHRTLLYGGIFGYPSDHKNQNGKLRLLYEAAPMSFLMEQAGGKALAQDERILEIVPSNVHQRVPCVMGSLDDVNELLKYYDNTEEEQERFAGGLFGVRLPTSNKHPALVA